MYYDAHNNMDVAITCNVAARTATVTGSTVDLQGYQAAEFVLITGILTDGTHTVALNESDDGTTWTTIAAADILGTAITMALTDDSMVKRCGYIGAKRYIRANSNVSGTTTGGIYGIVVLRSRPALKPLT